MTGSHVLAARDIHVLMNLPFTHCHFKIQTTVLHSGMDFMNQQYGKGCWTEEN